MNNAPLCLSQDVLDQICRDELLPDELRCIEDHVSECEHCRDLFAAATAEPDWTEAILPILRAPREAAPSETASDSSVNDAVLSLLGPTDDPRMLGRIGAYEVMGVVGRGGMGIVFKAFDAALNRFVAIKMLLPHLATSAAARKRFSREGQAAAAVIDDHVLPIYAVDQWQGVPYLVTQYSSGMSLQKRIQDQGPLELKEILRIGLQTARGMAAAHGQGLVHRDVKPSNILLDGTVERALLTDFGLARAVDDASITRHGAITGTPQFMAPEQARGEAVDQRSDLFSLGAVMYAMCTGRPPFRAETSLGVMRLIADKMPQPIQEVNADIPGWLCAIIGKLMSKQPSERFGSAHEVAELLEDCLAHVQQPATAPLPMSVQQLSASPPRSTQPQLKVSQRFSKTLRRVLVGAALGSLLLLAAILVVLESNKGTIRIESKVDNIRVRITQSNEVVERLSVSKAGNSVRMRAGDYVIELEGEHDELEVENARVALRRRGTEVVTIVQQTAAEGDNFELGVITKDWGAGGRLLLHSGYLAPDATGSQGLPLRISYQSDTDAIKPLVFGDQQTSGAHYFYVENTTNQAYRISEYEWLGRRYPFSEIVGTGVRKKLSIPSARNLPSTWQLVLRGHAADQEPQETSSSL